MIGVVIPTITGREAYLERALYSYSRRTAEPLRYYVIPDLATCGLAWQAGADRAQADGCDYLHLTADDIVPNNGWDRVFRRSADAGEVPCGLVVAPLPETLDENEMPVDDAVTGRRQFFERLGDETYIPDGFTAYHDSEYPAIPFCSMGQWQQIGPMIASHYGTDKWFGYRARLASIPVVVRHGPRFYHYAAHAGRLRDDGWMHTDRLDFDLNVSWPEYVGGTLHPSQRHPLDGTPEGRQAARRWRMDNVPPPFPWDEDPDLPEIYR